MTSLKPVALPALPSGDLSDRFATALYQVQTKLVALAASAPLLLVALAIVLASLWLGGLISRHLLILNRLSQRNPYLDGLLRGIVKTLIVLAGVLVALDLLGATSLVGAVLGSAGVIGLVLGFAFKDIAENYVAGILLSLRKPFSPGDTVRVEGHEGKVVALTSRATVLMTIEGNHLMLPNALVFKSVLLNFSRNPKRRFEFELDLNAGASLHGAMDTGISALASMEGVLAEPAPAALILEIPSGGARLQFVGWIDQSHNDLARTRSEALRRVFKSLQAAGMAPAVQVQHVRLEHSDENATRHVHETETERDTSVDHALDAQLGQARSEESSSDLLKHATTGNEPPP
ncbi:mechanosensitive ion channel domain-containing protein [Thermomonas sp.]|uniref:mechanosensitive ion channel family protein n=1 Tax=Thermomonas sp. TaxID=1971895 RepID=UPI002487B0A5|nr:mechanosensitive ion channel domain-containing protein [Thermomonas sp.]MDI1253572.1 mechanosensitive ion channel [Thermomonas sp.]